MPVGYKLAVDNGNCVRIYENIVVKRAFKASVKIKIRVIGKRAKRVAVAFRLVIYLKRIILAKLIGYADIEIAGITLLFISRKIA